MSDIGLGDATRVVDAALAHGQQLGFAPLTVAVLDRGGHLVCLKRADNSGLLRPDIAVAKAWGVLGMGLPVTGLLERARAMPDFFHALAVLAGGRMIPVAGGVGIRDAAGTLLGAVGTSGDTSLNDEVCALHGIRVAGLQPWME